MATPGGGTQSVPHQRRADTVAAMRRIDRERPEQQSRTGRTRCDLPEPHGADDATVLDRDERQPPRGLAAGAQAFGGLREADRPIGQVEQRLAGGGVGWLLKTDGDHGTLPVFLVPALRQGWGGRAQASPCKQGKAATRWRCQMWMVFSGEKPLKATAA